MSAVIGEAPAGVVPRPSVVALPHHIGWLIVGVKWSLRSTCRLARRIAFGAEDGVDRRKEGARKIVVDVGDSAVKGRHVEIGGAVVRQPQPGADAVVTLTGGHTLGNLERRDPLAHAAVIDAEDGKVVPADLLDVTLVGDSQSAARQ